MRVEQARGWEGSRWRTRSQRPYRSSLPSWTYDYSSFRGVRDMSYPRVSHGTSTYHPVVRPSTPTSSTQGRLIDVPELKGVSGSGAVVRRRRSRTRPKHLTRLHPTRQEAGNGSSSVAVVGPPTSCSRSWARPGHTSWSYGTSTTVTGTRRPRRYGFWLTQPVVFGVGVSFTPTPRTPRGVFSPSPSPHSSRTEGKRAGRRRTPGDVD